MGDNSAHAEVQEHVSNKPAEPLIPRGIALMGKSKEAWENLDRWETEYEDKKAKTITAWAVVGGKRDDLKDESEFIRRGTRKYAEEEAAKRWKEDDFERNRAERQVKRESPGKYEELGAMMEELKKLELKAEAAANTPEAIRDRRIVELDHKLNNPPYWIGSAGYPVKAAQDDANELITLEMMKLYDESGGECSQQEALEAALQQHPVIEELEKKFERDLGIER